MEVRWFTDESHTSWDPIRITQCFLRIDRQIVFRIDKFVLYLQFVKALLNWTFQLSRVLPLPILQTNCRVACTPSLHPSNSFFLIRGLKVSRPLKFYLRHHLAAIMRKTHGPNGLEFGAPSTVIPKSCYATVVIRDNSAQWLKNFWMMDQVLCVVCALSKWNGRKTWILVDGIWRSCPVRRMLRHDYIYFDNESIIVYFCVWVTKLNAFAFLAHHRKTLEHE